MSPPFQCLLELCSLPPHRKSQYSCLLSPPPETSTALLPVLEKGPYSTTRIQQEPPSEGLVLPQGGEQDPAEPIRVLPWNYFKVELKEGQQVCWLPSMTQPWRGQVYRVRYWWWLSEKSTEGTQGSACTPGHLPKSSHIFLLWSCLSLVRRCCMV